MSEDINQSGIIPTGGHILVRPDKVEEVTAGGIIMPQETRDREQLGTTVGIVIAIGLDAWSDLNPIEPWAKVGDKINYAKHAGYSMRGQDGQDYVMMNDVDVLARLLF